MNSGIAATLRTHDATLFVKGIPTDHPQARHQELEAAINPHLPAASPRLLWRVQTEGWDLLGYERIEGHHADYTPGSLDLPLITDALVELQHTPCPDLPIKRAEQRWSHYASPDCVEQLAGDTLLHTDFAWDNILITDRAHIIDWAWPTRGAAWIDPAVLILRLMNAGHSAPAADARARQIPSWQAAPRPAVRAFSEANARLWDEIARSDPQPWKKSMARHAHDWLTYWSARP
ncbi:aminoglycoside phosphotransferase [Streptomyces sp. NBC_00286]|uniref:aminoglycoside phosphotransferase n=1 Tax=Streptomyces sp. NBC_00286 TaxID=2975701 RepID=UPI002E29F0E9|nr:aminoglycoside phosphotransferase [Streptomyces sp. NBC_00286]